MKKWLATNPDGKLPTNQMIENKIGSRLQVRRLRVVFHGTVLSLCLSMPAELLNAHRNYISADCSGIVKNEAHCRIWWNKIGNLVR